MDAQDLTPEQRQRFRVALAKHWGELQRYEAWMRSKGWVTGDVPLVALAAANNALHAAIAALVQVERLPPKVKHVPPSSAGPDFSHLMIAPPTLPGAHRSMPRRRRR